MNPSFGHDRFLYEIITVAAVKFMVKPIHVPNWKETLSHRNMLYNLI